MTQSAGFDLVVIGTGFGSLFFVEGFLRARPQARVLFLERGRNHPHAWQIEHGRNSDVSANTTYRVPAGHKPWRFTIGLGGGTNCWFGHAPRFHPNDFRTATLYGVGRDWPLTYDDLEPYYADAERIMAVAGSDAMQTVLPRSTPFPLPPHILTSADEIMARAQPERHFPLPTARASVPTGRRPQCCASARCNLCPVDAKFTYENGLSHLMTSPGVELRLDCEVTRLETRGGVVTAAVYASPDGERTVAGDLFVLGANAIHSPAILLRSGLDGPLVGAGINEQVGYTVDVWLDGLDSLNGGTITTGLNYALCDGDFRREHGGALIYFENRWPNGLRTEYGRWRQLAPISIVVEDLPDDDHRVTLDPDGMPRVWHEAISDYAARGVAAARANLERVLAPLPVERIEFHGQRASESHIQGSLRMGRTPADSVVDAGQIHHQLRNLVVVGSAVFPSCPAANPSLSVAALSLRSADRLA